MNETKEKMKQLESIENNPYVQVMNNQRAAVHIIDRDFKLIFINSFFKKWMDDMGMGFSENPIGHSIFKMFPFLKKNVREEYREVLESGQPLFSEDMHKIDGRKIFSETQKSPVMKNGEVAEIITIIQDVTQERKAEEVRRASEEKFRRLFELP